MVGFCEATVATVMEKDEDKSGYVDAGESEASGQPCVSCAHYRRKDDPHVFTHRCEHPRFGSTRDRVVGADVRNSADAYAERSGFNGPDACGPEGKFWARSGF
jgi:hypothetical protein